MVIMDITNENKQTFINTIKNKLSQFQEVNKIILFGSFVNSNTPNDIDIAIVQTSNENYLSLSLKYKKVLRELSKIIPLDIIPLQNGASGVFMQEINKGNIVYER